MQESILSGDELLGKKLDLLLYIGSLLLKCLADSNRINRNLRRAAAYMGIPAANFHMHINYTSLIINISEGKRSVTKLIKVRTHVPNMNVLSEISNFTWKALQENYPLDRFEEEIRRIGKMTAVYPRPLLIAATGIACGGFARLFGADIPAMFIAAFAAALGLFIRQELSKRKINSFMVVVVSAFVSTSIALLATFTTLSNTPSYSMLASVLYLIPGVPFINSIDDMIDGYTMVGVTRSVVATLVIGSIAFGMLLAMELFGFHEHDAATSTIGIMLLAPAIASIGFAMLFNVPVKALPICAAGGITVVFVKQLLLSTTNMSVPLSTFMAAMVIGCAAIYLIHKVHVPLVVLTIPAIIPLVPGVLMYETMMGIFMMGSGSVDAVDLVTTVQSGLAAIFTILAISTGIAIPNIIGRKFLSKKELAFEKKYPDS